MYGKSKNEINLGLIPSPMDSISQSTNTSFVIKISHFKNYGTEKGRKDDYV